jgi:hypothetical protein
VNATAGASSIITRRSIRQRFPVGPNPSLSPRPATAGRLARVARWFMLHHTGKPPCLRGRG